jgi:glycine/D-amino acid oxidase-like deaminating enzyme
LAKSGADTLMLDQGDRDLRAARGNFGLLWVQGKGADFPEYARWTQLSTKLWPQFAADLESLTGIDVQLQQRGGIHYCVDAAEMTEYEQELALQRQVSDGQFEYQMLNASELRAIEPNIGPEVFGGAYSPNDGHVNPLYLLRAMQAAFIACGGSYRPRHNVLKISKDGQGFLIDTEQGQFHCQKVILAAGLDNTRLAAMLELQQPLRPERGQLLITERLPKLLNYPSLNLRQTHEGGIQIGYSAEDVGLDDNNTTAVMAQLAERAITLLPALAQRNIVRGWGALRILTPDGYPIYQQRNETQAYAFSCHSAVTLAAVHALQLAPMILAGQLQPDISAFSAERFNH